MFTDFDAKIKNQPLSFIYEVTADTLPPNLDSDTFFTSMNDYVPETNILINSSKPGGKNPSRANFITHFYSPAPNEIPPQWRKYLPTPFCFHVHDYCQVTKVNRGKVLYIVNNMQVEMGEGDILIINANSVHSWMAVEGTTSIGIDFYPSQLSLNEYCMQYDNAFSLFYSMRFPYLHIPKDVPVYRAVNQCLENILGEYHSKQAANTVMAHNYFIELSLLCMRAYMKLPDSTGVPFQKSETLRQAMTYITEHLDTLASVREVAEHVHLNSCYFSNFFRKKAGVSCTKYIALQRLARAAELLKSTDIPISDIIFKCGFQSLSSFYQLFGSLYTVSPAKFRKLYQ